MSDLPIPKQAAKQAAKQAPKQAMLLAAGLATRMRPISETIPKALIEIEGRTVLDNCLDRLIEAGVEKIVINTHHLGDKIEAHVAARATAKQDPEIIYSREDILLETGGGIAKALPHFGDDPFLVINAKMLWSDGPTPMLERLAALWNDDKMDGLLLVHETVEAFGYQGRGDFLVDPLGHVVRRPEIEVAPYVFTGLQILHPRMFADIPEGAFSLNLLYDRAIEAERLFAMVHDGEWFLIETLEGLDRVRRYLTQRLPAARRRGR